MTENTPKKYTRSDYSVLNEHFTQAIDREKEIVRAKRSQTFWQNAKSISLILFFLGIAAVFIGKAYYFAKKERIVEVYNSQNPRDSVVTIDGNEVSVKKDVTHFITLDVPMDDNIYYVMTRHNYVDPRDQLPATQSCYMRIDKKSNLKYEISELKNGTISLQSYNLQSDVAQQMGIKEPDITYFQKFCRYI